MIKIQKVVGLFTVLFLSLWAYEADDVVGTYHLPNGLEVEIYREGASFSI